MKKTLMIISASLALVISASASASTNKCQGLKEELQAMKQAQAQIMQSLVNNHETFATTMEEYSSNVDKAPRTVSKQMNKSAQAFRTRGVQGKQIADKLNRATNDLIERVASCL